MQLTSPTHTLTRAFALRITTTPLSRGLPTSPPLHTGTMSSADHNNPPDPSQDKRSDGTEPHQHQAGSTTHRPEDQWKFRPPYSLASPSDSVSVKWRGKCHCGAIRYTISRARPLAAKYCHCTTCQRLHGAPFQWAAIFHKTDINFTQGHHDLGWYDPAGKKTNHTLPCKVKCAYCGTPVMDEGRYVTQLPSFSFSSRGLSPPGVLVRAPAAQQSQLFDTQGSLPSADVSF